MADWADKKALSALLTGVHALLLTCPVDDGVPSKKSAAMRGIEDALMALAERQKEIDE